MKSNRSGGTGSSIASSETVAQVLVANTDSSWEISDGSFAGFKLEYYNGSFPKDLTVTIRLLGTPPKALYIKADQVLDLPLTLTMPDILIPQPAGLVAADLSNVGLTMIEEDSGNLVSLALQAEAKTKGQLQTSLKKFGIISVTSGSGAVDSSEISELKKNLEEVNQQLDDIKTTGVGVNAVSAFSITSPLAPLNSSSATVTWQTSTNAATYTLTVASDVACTTSVQTFAGLTTTSKALTGLTSGIQYLCIAATDAGGKSKMATNNGIELRVDIDAPVVPAAPVPASVLVTSSAVSFTWSAVADVGPSGLSHYELQVGTSAGANDIFNAAVSTSLSKTLTSIGDGVYFARVRAVDGVDNASAWSSDSVATRVDSSVPTAASSLKTAASGAAGIDVRFATSTGFWVAWTAGADGGSGVRDYSLTQFLGSGCTGTGTDIATAIVGTSKDVTGVDGQIYSYKVKTYDLAGLVSLSGCSGSMTVDATPPPALDGMIATSGTAVDGTIDIALDFPAFTADVVGVSIIRKAGAVAPANCTDGAVILNTTNYTDRTVADAAGTPGSYFSYLACVTDAAGLVTSSNTSVNVQARVRSHKMFATSGTFTGNLGGLAGADAKCQAAAIGAGIIGDFAWKALLSASTVNANARVSIKGPIFRVDGTTIIANSASDFWDGSLQNVVNTEFGASILGSVWTGSNMYGANAGQTCGDWTTGGADGRRGVGNAINSSWMDAGAIGGGNIYSIYCINEYSSAPLTAFNAVTGANDNGDVDLTIDFPAVTTFYGKVELRRLVGATAPNADCTSNGTMFKTYTSFADATFTDSSLLGGGRYSYRACVYDNDNVLVPDLGLTKTSVYAKGTYHRIFVTSSSFDGALGGLSGADGICANAATTAGLTGQWIALISTSTVDAKDRIWDDGPFYNMLGAMVGANENDVWDGSFSNIYFHEYLGSSLNTVWSGSNLSGVTTNSNCNDWTSSSSGISGQIGSSGFSTDWFWMGASACNGVRSLICISHQSIPPLNAFTAATGVAADGDVILSLTYPADTTLYGRVDIRRTSERTLPNKDCSSTGTLVSSITNFATTAITDATGSAGAQFSYRACIYDDSDRLVASSNTITGVYSKGQKNTIFATSNVYDGNLGGLAGADAKCAASASNAGLAGTFVALLSTSTLDARDRLTIDGRFYTVNNLLVASSKADLFDGTIANSIYDEFGATTGGEVWTGSSQAGVKNGSYCPSEWGSSASSIGSIGHPGNNDANWLNFGGLFTCVSTLKLYCVQQ